MSKKNIYDTNIINSIDMKHILNSMTKFLVTSRNSISISDKTLRNINETIPMINTVISDIYKMLLNESKLNLFSFIDLITKSNVPDGFMFTYWNLDVLQIQEKFPSEYRVLTSFPEFNNRIIFNIENLINKKTGAINDINFFQQIIIRDTLSRSYFNFTDSWLTPNIIYYLAKFYSIILSSHISRLYNLSYNEQIIIATVLAIFFTQKCFKNTSLNPILNRFDFLGRFVAIKDISDQIEKEYNNKELTISDICKLIVEFSPTRVSKFSEKVFYSLSRNVNLNQILSSISIEYPPYWCFNILLSLSGVKSNIYHTMKKLNMKNDLIGFTRELSSSATLIKSIF